ncbi:olfactory receptor 5V1-like [Aquarana catesbeiana]|uniref:olfactory receptor 5V1-like n=1 Tax=Aquarana catesbeiana TaxID=8400 RepID=UPI003CC9C8A7
MLSRNDTLAGKFILLGFSSDPQLHVLLFLIFLLVYMILLTGNFLTIVLIVRDTNLHTPMYFFLSNLSFLDLCYSTTTVPRILRDLVSAKKIITYAECAIQLYIHVCLGLTECILLAIMAYDRFVAICYPLHYTTIMSKKVCVRIVSTLWSFGFLIPIIHVILTFKVDLCGNNKINNFLCNIPEILSLSCENTIFLELFVFASGMIILITPVIFIAVSYIQIILSILKIASSNGRKKAFSTCGSHVIVVTIFYGSAITDYMIPKSSMKPETDKLITIFYCILTPMLNPAIYTLRNNNVKLAFRKFRSRYFSANSRKCCHD